MDISKNSDKTKIPPPIDGEEKPPEDIKTEPITSSTSALGQINNNKPDALNQKDDVGSFLDKVINLAKIDFFYSIYKQYFPVENSRFWYNLPHKIVKYLTLLLEVLFRFILAIIIILTLSAGFILLVDTVGIIKKEDAGCIATTLNLDYCRGLRKDPEEKSATTSKTQSSQSSQSSQSTNPIPLKDRGSKYITIPAFIPSE